MTERKVQFPSVLQIIQLFILEIKINRNGCLKKITDFQRISALTRSSESVLPFPPGGRGDLYLSPSHLQSLGARLGRLGDGEKARSQTRF